MRNLWIIQILVSDHKLGSNHNGYWTHRNTNFLNVVSIIVFYFSFIFPSDSRDVKPQVENYFPDYNVYHNLTHIQTHLLEIVGKYPNYMKIDWSYKSREGRPQMALRITNFTDSLSHYHVTSESIPSRKVRVLLSYGEHAREFLPVESMFHLLKNITQGLSVSNPSHPAYIFSRLVLSRLDLFIVAIVNPDGRQYVEKSQNFCWRGTSTGVDINRNFDWNFGSSKGSSDNIKDEEYRGTAAFSEPECLVLTDLTLRYSFDAFVSLHSGIRQIYVPFADSDSKRLLRQPENIDSMLDLSNQMAQATANSYTYGLAYQLNDYTADGTIFDYMAGVRKIPFSFAIELWGEGDSKGVKCFDLFNPDNNMLQSTVQEIQPLYATLFTYLISWKDEQLKELLNHADETPSLVPAYMLLGLVILLSIVVAAHTRISLCFNLFPRRRIVSLRSLSSTFSAITLMRS